MKAPGIICFAAIFVLVAGVAPAAGTVITIGFSGEINYVEDGLPLSDEISAGMPFEGAYTYNTDAEDVNPDDPQGGGYLFPDYTMSTQFGALEFETTNLGIAIFIHSLLDRYSAGNYSAFISNGIEWRSMGIVLSDRTATAFPNDLLPADAPNLDDFEYERIFFLQQEGNPEFSVTGEITSIYRVPEPSALALLATGVFLCARRRKQDRATPFVRKL